MHAITSAPPLDESQDGCPPGDQACAFDSHVYTGYDIPPFYDSLIGKLIVWGKDRDHAMTRMKRALNECAVTGIPTTVEFHLRNAGSA